MTDELVERLNRADEYEPLGHDGWEAADRIEQLTAERDRLRGALRDIARQKKADEMDTEYDVEYADFEGGYNAIIDVARVALRAVQPDLTDPVVVHANMLRGTIAKPTLDQIIHLYGVDALCRALVPAISREAALDEMTRLGQEFDAALKGETP